MKSALCRLIPVCFLVCVLVECGTQKKLNQLHRNEAKAQLNLGNDMNALPEIERRDIARDTLKVMDDDGKELLIMKAIREDETGEMVINDVIDAAYVTARFRNVSEHAGKVDLAFDIVVPASIQDSRWQLRFYPDMYILDDSLRLDPVIITGNTYRKEQLRGYQQYERFLSRIVSDSTRFINLRLLEAFLERNIPQLYSFKNDSSYVDDGQFLSCFGVSEQQAIEHYTNKIAKSLNDHRKSILDKKYRKYVKSPIVSEGIRLDTVMVSDKGDFVYNYVQTINTRPRLRKVDIVLSGDIWEQGNKIYDLNKSEPLTFYISSISAFADDRERYIKKVIERRVEANTACYVDFDLGKSDINLSLGHNREEMARIKTNLAQLMENKSFDLDSIVVTAFASPEGKMSVNERLSEARSISISRYLDAFMQSYQDSLEIANGLTIGESGDIIKYARIKVPFISHSAGENWDMLDMLIIRDTLMSEGQKSMYSELSLIPDLDDREQMMQKMPSYNYMRSVLYPRLRTVKFDFHLHRKGMVKDTVNTTVLDTVYMSGVKALKDMDYNLAIKFLLPYKDFNAAVACLATDRNLSALQILESLHRTAEVNYLLAVAYSRTEEYQKAVQCYMDACRDNPSYVFRGNLDPEISFLIKTYGLNKDE